LFLRKELFRTYDQQRWIGKSDPLKILTGKEFRLSRTSKNIKQFLDLAGYHRQYILKYILNFSKIAKPLMNLLKKDEKFLWNEAQDKGFTEL